MAKKTIDIEGLLQWAYGRELPKGEAVSGASLSFGFRTGWGGVERYGELLAVVQEPDVRNRFGLFPDFCAQSEPHPDAVAIHEAVEGLAGLDYEQPEGWDPLSDMGDLGVEGAAAVARGLARLLLVEDMRGADVAVTPGLRGARVVGQSGDGAGEGAPQRGRRLRLRRSPARLVIRHAILADCPPWEAEAPERRFETFPNGTPRWFRRVVQVSDGAFGPAQHEMEVDGFDAKRRRPYPDAYRKAYLEPDPADAVRCRAEYEIWHAAMGILAQDLSGVLCDHAPLPPARSARPWVAPDPERRILPSLLALPAESPERRSGRETRKREAA